PLPGAVAPVPAPPVLPAPAGPGPEVAPLTDLRAPDLLVTVPATLRPEQVAALNALPNLAALSVVDAGTVRVAGQDARLLGVDPSSFRAFTPQETARSDELWQAVARGEVAPTYILARDRQLTLGGPITMAGSAEVPGRVGALAAFGLPGVDLVTDTTKARALGVVPASAVLVSAPRTSITALKKAIQGALGPEAVVDVLRPEVVRSAKGKPRNYRDLYIDSARYCKGLSWTVLAAIGQVESAHGQHLGPSSAGALGPMQFLPSTWAAYGVDGDGDGSADIMSPYDAVPSSAAYLCRFGANRGPDGLYDAIFAYNRADWYVQKVLGLAAQYR
ncbi:MAG: lytic transglycosylase domain-containing protein, partial [Actinomycetota bacterium]|nr:lytic transglycosylase domain-containing protein [Actinomycetota bacterium]